MQYHDAMKKSPSVLCCMLMGLLFCAGCATTTNVSSGTKSGTKVSGNPIPLTYQFGEEAIKNLGGLGSQNCETTLHPAQKLVAEPVYHSKRPLYAMMQFGMEKKTRILVALDESKGTCAGYDMLYLDLNGNMDLTDDGVCLGKHAENRDEKQFTFPIVELKVNYGDGERPYHVKFSLYDYGRPNLQLETACYYKGDISLGGKPYKIALLDVNANGLFNDPSLESNEGGGGQVQVEGDRFLLDLKGDGVFENIGSGFHTFFLGKYLVWGRKCYEMSIDPTGRSLTLVESKAKCGSVAIENPGTSAIFLGKDGGLRVTGENTAVPEGSYHFYRTILEAKDKEGMLWRTFGYGMNKEAPIVVVAHKKKKLILGAPFTGEVNVKGQGPNAYRISLSIKGLGGEVYDTDTMKKVGKNESKVPAPRLRIVDKEGKNVVNAEFSSGCGNSRSYYWQVPKGLIGEYEAIPEISTGPFPIKAISIKFTVQ